MSRTADDSTHAFPVFEVWMLLVFTPQTQRFVPRNPGGLECHSGGGGGGGSSLDAVKLISGP